MQVLDNIKFKFAAVDIDGTIKDLVKENTNALNSVMKKMGNIHLTKRGKFVLYMNKINMYFVKTGMLPTNQFMQNILLFVYSILLLKSYNVFKEIYFEEYNKENIFFECAEEMVNNLSNSDLIVYLMTKNRQNKRMISLKDNNIIKNTKKIIIGRTNTPKYSMYKSFFSTNYICMDEVLIIGDNFWDDVLPAIILGSTVVWCNMYNSKLKRVVINILKFFFRNIRDERELFVSNWT